MFLDLNILIRWIDLRRPRIELAEKAEKALKQEFSEISLMNALQGLPMTKIRSIINLLYDYEQLRMGTVLKKLNY